MDESIKKLTTEFCQVRAEFLHQNNMFSVLAVLPKAVILDEKEINQAVLGNITIYNLTKTDLSKKLPQNIAQVDELSRAKMYCIVRSIMSEFFTEMFGFSIHRFRF